MFQAMHHIRRQREATTQPFADWLAVRTYLTTRGYHLAVVTPPGPGERLGLTQALATLPPAAEAVLTPGIPQAQAMLASGPVVALACPTVSDSMWLGGTALADSLRPAGGPLPPEATASLIALARVHGAERSTVIVDDEDADVAMANAATREAAIAWRRAQLLEGKPLHLYRHDPFISLHSTATLDADWVHPPSGRVAWLPMQLRADLGKRSILGQWHLPREDRPSLETVNQTGSELGDPAEAFAGAQAVGAAPTRRRRTRGRPSHQESLPSGGARWAYSRAVDLAGLPWELASRDPEVLVIAVWHELGLEGQTVDPGDAASAVLDWEAIARWAGVPAVDAWSVIPDRRLVARDRDRYRARVRTLLEALTRVVGPRSAIAQKRALGRDLTPLELVQEALFLDQSRDDAQQATALARRAGVPESTAREMLTGGGPQAFHRLLYLAEEMGYRFRLERR